MSQSSCELFMVLLAILIAPGCADKEDAAMTPTAPKSPRILVGHADVDERELPEGVVVHKSRDPDEPARVSREPIVVDDRAQIDECRRVYEQSVSDLQDQAIALVNQGEWLFLEHERALKERRTESLKTMHALLADKNAKPVARAKAAQILASLEDSKGEQFLFDALRSNSTELRLAALRILREYSSRFIDLSLPDRAAAVCALLADEDEEVVQAVADLCAYREIPGAEAKLLAVLKAGNLTNPNEFSQKLARLATTHETIDTVLPLIMDSLPERYPSYEYVFRKVLESPDSSVREPVRKAIFEIALQYEDQRYDQSLVCELAHAADSDAISVLEDIRANATDPISRTYAVEAMARLQPDKAVNLMLDLIESQGPRSHIIQGLRQYVGKPDYDRVVPVILSSQKGTGRPLGTEFVRLCLSEFGERGRAFVQDKLDDLDEDARMWAKWKLQNIDLRTVLGELHEAGVISTSPDRLITKMREGRSENSQSLDLSNPHELASALVCDEIVVMFDAETGTLPCNHDWLVLLFTEYVGDRFRPQWPVQLWHQEDEDDFDAPYTLQFVYQDRLFRTGAENDGDWYDVEAVVRLLNFALETTGQAERFIGLAANGQCPVFVLANPNAFVPIANKYGLALSDDASNAMRTGIESERRVIESRKE